MRPMAFRTRAATAADYPSFARLFPELRVPDPVPSAEHFAAHVLPHVLLLCDGAATLGYAHWRLYGRTAHVVNVVVDPSARGRGGGRVLLDAVRELVVRAGCTRWYLNVKRDNEPALRLYRACGLAVEHEAWALRLAWAQVDRLAGDGAAVPLRPAPADDAAIAARFALDPERLALLRARPTTILTALREHDAWVAFTAFDPQFPGAYPFRVTRIGLARPLLDACRPHAALDRFDFLRLTIEGDAALKDVLLAAGADLAFSLLQLGAPLPT